MPTISDRLINVTGTVTEHENIYVRSYVRSGEDHLITGEQERIPVGEDGLVTVTIESGPAVLIIQREATVYSRADIIPIWVPEYDTTIREAMELGKTHQNMDGDTAQDLVEQILSTISGAVAEGLAQIEEAAEGTVDLSSYATIVYVDEQIEQIELTPGRDGKDGQDGEDGISPHIDQTTGNWHIGDTDTGVKAQGQDGQDGQDGQNGQDGISPHIDQTTGKWFIGDTDTGVKAQGQDGQDGVDGKDGKDGDPGASAYEVWISAGNTGTETEFLSSLKGDPGQNAEPLTVTSTTETQDGVELSLSDGTTVMIPRGPKGNPGQDGVTPHIDQVSGNWYLGDQDTGVQAQGPKGDPSEGGTGETGTSSGLKTVSGIPTKTDGVEPGTVVVDDFSGLAFRAMGSFGLEKIDETSIPNIGMDPTSMNGQSTVMAPGTIVTDGTGFYQLQPDYVTWKKVEENSLYGFEMYFGYGVLNPGTAVYLTSASQEYEIGLYLVKDIMPVEKWKLFVLSPDAEANYMITELYNRLNTLTERVRVLENP